MDRKPIMLMILDGFGINENEKGNAVKLANTPNIDKLMKIWPTTQIHTSGLAVGLPEGQMGNSEVGHTNIGAGRVVYQDLTRITKSIEASATMKEKAKKEAAKVVKEIASGIFVDDSNNGAGGISI